MKTLPMRQRNMNDSIHRKTNDKIKMIKNVKVAMAFKALINRT